jgi:hypothetical protein
MGFRLPGNNDCLLFLVPPAEETSARKIARSREV